MRRLTTTVFMIMAIAGVCLFAIGQAIGPDTTPREDAADKQVDPGQVERTGSAAEESTSLTGELPEGEATDLTGETVREANMADIPQHAGNVFVLPLEGPIDKSLMMLFRRAFREIKRIEPDAVILEVNTPGGSLQETKEIGAWLLSQDMPVYTFVNTDALSAGAILSFATDKIFMHPAATIGSALPILISPGGGLEEVPENVEEKILSATRSLVRSYAQQKGHREEIATAMVDPEVEVKIGDEIICAKGELLNLTAKEAVRIIAPEVTPVLAQAVADDLDEVLAHVGLAGSRLTRFEIQPAEKLARILVALGPLFFSLGILGIIIEFYTPGFGVAGITGLILIATFFLGHYVAGLAGVEEIALVTIGLILIALEVFVIPGFGVAGISGIALVSIGTVMAMIPHLPKFVPTGEPTDFDAPSFLMYLEVALMKFVSMVFLVVVGAWIVAKIFPKTKAYSKLVLTTSLSQSGGFVSHDDRSADLLGQIGVAYTLLRPAGIAMFGTDRVDVVTTGELVSKGDPIKVVEVSAGRVVVEKAPESAPTESGDTEKTDVV